MFSFLQKGNFDRTDGFLKKMSRGEIFAALERYGQIGVNALASNTARDLGVTAASWGYKVERTGRSYTIAWMNGNLIRTGVPVVILLQYGHGTGTGGYVQGYDFINPAIRPVFDQLAEDVWKAVVSA